MVKGISRQVIVVHSPDPKLFEQAIFILKDGAVGQEGITDDVLIKEAKQLLSRQVGRKKRFSMAPVWAAAGALATGIVWFISAVV